MSDITRVLILTAIGMGTVFMVLLLFCAVIYLLMRIETNKKEKPAAAGAAAGMAAAVSESPAARFIPIVELNGVDDKTAATVMAVVAHESDIPLEELHFLSIKESKEDSK
jgi:Na+-transporting methylmalonyl-CoA/oxaloacetate decarboxylase gamma subunit